MPATNDSATFDPQSRPKWSWLYYVLAAFDVLAVCTSLYLNHQIMQIYVRSVETNQSWASILNDVSRVGELAAAANAPGNEVFDASEGPTNRQSMRSAVAAFKHSIARLNARLATEIEDEIARPLLEHLVTTRQLLTEMTREAELVFIFVEASQRDRAVRHMAAMDRKYAALTAVLLQLRDRVGRLQQRNFESQANAAAWLQRSEYIMAALIMLMIAGATFYGYFLAGQVATETRLKEQYRAELERRVEERTAELVAANEVRAELLRQLITAQEDERRRIARDLHDGIGQSLTLLLVSLSRIQAAQSRAESHQQAAGVQKVASGTLDEVRRMARGLRPSVLDDLGLTVALERMVEDYTASNDISVALDGSDLEGQRLPGEIETAVYRIIQEALTNIAKHAQATKVGIAVQREHDRIELVVRDNGRGFQIEQQAGSKPRSEFGLSGMRERASLLGGSATITSNPGRGTTVHAYIPLPGNVDADSPRGAEQAI